ncbi:hypothetical protein HYDPIDRAFT_164304 [Hydnomerulius pinastri MD-312]|nr:hypothetical protein HYDPIDRAFT_164304 [Hydnomerulius pinastri MD-312]
MPFVTETGLWNVPLMVDDNQPVVPQPVATTPHSWDATPLDSAASFHGQYTTQEYYFWPPDVPSGQLAPSQDAMHTYLSSGNEHQQQMDFYDPDELSASKAPRS